MTLDVSTLTDTASCGDIMIAVADPAETRTLEIRLDGILEKIPTGSTSTRLVLALEDGVVEVRHLRGTNLWSHYCRDDLSPGEGAPQIAETMVALSGTVRLDLDEVSPPSPWGERPARAHLRLENLRFQAPDGTVRVLTLFELDDLRVGWMAG